MLFEFLSTYREELISEKSDVEAGLEAIRTRLLESEKFLDVIKEETEEVFTDFTPRNINSKNQARIDETEAEIHDYKDQIEALEIRLSKIDSRLKETSAAIHEAKSLRQRTGRDVSVEKDVLLNIISYLPADPIRAKIELENLI